MCCARAIVTAKARIDKHPKWGTIRQGRPIQRDLAVKLQQKAEIPEGQLAEVSFADLEDRPLEMVEEIYKTLGLEGFDNASPYFKSYVDKMKSYKKNRHEAEPELLKRIEKEWGFAIKEWGYD